MQHDMPIGAFSARTGCAIETIRFYEKIGILPKPRRRGRYRLYEADDVARLVFVRRARELGFTLDEVRALLRLSGLGADACGEVRELAASHLKDVRKRIADLRAMERALIDAVRRCDAGADAACPLIETLSAV
ncbi:MULTISPECIES: helix-turn-helix domain-containing protein [unclassified Acidocella]|uniref:MerR family transcriptional regulator n=1 Tax=unclassified Acidocella TaxID=2648610 RepID=UPI00028E48A8|nr:MULTISPECIES: helix-turn-helix domain-containing protein [unclassified Acidocella]EKM98237.1 transcriptional regulator, MerR family protein [Acidocella sp. MX-AZ02]WBO61016.1 helix-turn-helix domain-containing protein [Acidocella sp. MX-AZ03]